MVSNPAKFCSDVVASPLAGTAKQAEVYVLFEWPNGWSRDILDGGTFGDELTARLKGAVKGVASLQLIRRPGRAGRTVEDKYRCYLVWPEHNAMELVFLSGPEQIADLDLSGPGRGGGEEVDGPLLLVCTHSKRDVCCAVKGRPLAAALAAKFPELVWETSHTKGHRFAPAVLLMPWGYSFGRLSAQQGQDLVEAALKGEYFFPSNRGRGTLSPRGQVAELAVAEEIWEQGLRYGQLRVEDPGQGPVRVTHADGRAWDVELEQREFSGVVASCGTEPGVARGWVAIKTTKAATPQQ